MQRFRKLTNSPGGAGAGVSGLSTADGGTPIADNTIIRGDGTTGIQSSVVLMDDSGNIQGPSGGFTITGGTAASNDLTIKATSNATRGDVIIKDSNLELATTGRNSYRLYINDTANNEFVISGSVYALLVGAEGYGINLGSGAAYKFAADANPFTTADTGICREVAGVVRVTTGHPAGTGKLQTQVVVEANTAVAASPNVLTATESFKVFTNEGATAMNYHTLPSAVAGYQYTFVVQDIDGIRVVAQAGDTIRIGATVSAGGGYCESITIGSSVTLTCINATEWIATSVVLGVWNVV